MNSANGELGSWVQLERPAEFVSERLLCQRQNHFRERIIHTYPHWGERNTQRQSLRIAVLSRQLKSLHMTLGRELRTWLSSCASQWSSLLTLSRNVCAAWRRSAVCTPSFDWSLASLSPIHKAVTSFLSLHSCLLS